MAEAFAAASQELLDAVRGGNATGALAAAARRAELVTELTAFGKPDVVTETLVAAGQRAGAEALECAAAQSAELRRELDSLGRGRTGLKAYDPARGTRENVWDLAG